MPTAPLSLTATMRLAKQASKGTPATSRLPVRALRPQ